MSKQDLLDEIRPLIVKLRKKQNVERAWKQFQDLIESEINEICSLLDTRWLVSICDTYVDYGDPVTRRNALLVVQAANLEKLWATNLLMYDLEKNEKKIELLKKNKVIPLWDGMYSFNINHGEMTNNFFKRVSDVMEDTPVIHQIWVTVLKRMNTEGTTLGKLNVYHQRLFEPKIRRSVVFVLRRKIRQFFRNYKFL